MYRDVISFLYGIFGTFHTFARSVMELLSHDVDLGDAGSISVGVIAFGAGFLTYAIVALYKFVVK